GRGLIQTVPVFYTPPEQLQNIADMGDISRATGLMCTVAPIVHNAASTLWKDSLDALDAEAARGARVFGQSMPRTFDINIRLSETSFLLYALPAWAEIMRMPLPERLAAFRDPARREDLRNQTMLLGPLMYLLTVGDTASPANAHLRGRSLAEMASERGVTPTDVMLDLACSEELKTEFSI